MLIAIAAIALGWFVDRTQRDRQELLGTWYYPTDDVGVLGYTSLLKLRDDGTFTKIQGYRTGHKTFDGTYEISDNGTVWFHVNKLTEGSDIIEMTGGEPTISNVKYDFRCRCAIDSAGFLVIDAHDWTMGKNEIGMHWETHARAKPDLLVVLE